MAENEETLELEEEDKKNALIAWLEEHPKTVFWFRFFLWVSFAGVLPFLFISWRFKLFNKVGQLQLSGFGIIAVIIAFVVVLSILKYIKLALSSHYSLIGQILGGFCKVILPLLAFMAILYSIKDSIESMIKVMGVVIVCESVAIPINPLPKWAYDMQKDVRVEERKETMDYLLDGFFSRKGKSGD